MRRGAWIALAVVVLAAVLAAMGSAAFLLWDLPREIGTVSINGHVVDLPRAHVGHWLLATLGLLLAIGIALVVVPAVFVVVLAVPLALAAFGLGVAALACVIVTAPLWLLVWWLWKDKAKARTIAP